MEDVPGPSILGAKCFRLQGVYFNIGFYWRPLEDAGIHLRSIKEITTTLIEQRIVQLPPFQIEIHSIIHGPFSNTVVISVSIHYHLLFRNGAKDFP